MLIDSQGGMSSQHVQKSGSGKTAIKNASGFVANFLARFKA
jgi:hypothetical protein